MENEKIWLDSLCPTSFVTLLFKKSKSSCKNSLSLEKQGRTAFPMQAGRLRYFSADCGFLPPDPL
jgi:hypothetical protein